VKKDSFDIQFYFNQEELKFQSPLFCEPDIEEAFRDNLSYLGQGQPNKDKTLAIVKASDNRDQNLWEKLTFIRLYEI
jgi:hypothetical protein